MVCLFFSHLSIIIDEKKNVAVYEHSSVKWNPWYDIRVDTKKKDKPVTLTYQACITQETGEVRISSSYHAVPY